MSRTIQTEVFLFSELSEEAKKKAIELNHINCADEWWDCIYEDADTIAEILGITFDRKGKHRSPAIYFSGFSSQGDGACFEGSYLYAKGAVKAIKGHAPLDTELHELAKQLQEVQRKHFYKLRATIRQSGHYRHSGCMSVSVHHDDDQYRDLGSAEQDITDTLRLFADWIYDQLEKLYDHLTSDEVIAESLEANEVEFLIDGSEP